MIRIDRRSLGPAINSPRCLPTSPQVCHLSVGDANKLHHVRNDRLSLMGSSDSAAQRNNIALADHGGDSDVEVGERGTDLLQCLLNAFWASYLWMRVIHIRRPKQVID